MQSCSILSDPALISLRGFHVDKLSSWAGGAKIGSSFGIFGQGPWDFAAGYKCHAAPGGGKDRSDPMDMRLKVVMMPWPHGTPAEMSWILVVECGW